MHTSTLILMIQVHSHFQTMAIPESSMQDISKRSEHRGRKLVSPVILKWLVNWDAPSKLCMPEHLCFANSLDCTFLLPSPYTSSSFRFYSKHMMLFHRFILSILYAHNPLTLLCPVCCVIETVANVVKTEHSSYPLLISSSDKCFTQ